MKEILMINPVKRRKPPKAKPAKGKKPMAKKRRKRAARRAAPAAQKTTTRRRRSYRKNPAPRRKGRARAAAGRLIGGLNFKEALKTALPFGIGMFAAKFAAKRFGSTGSETDPASWTWRTYLQAGAGAAVAGIAVNMVRPGMGQKVFQGGLALVLYKLIQNELVTKNEKAVEYFGYNGMGQNDGLLLDLNGDPYMMGPAGEEMPLDESHRMNLLGQSEVDNMYGQDEMYGADDTTWGEAMAPVGPLGFGEAMAPVGPLGRYGNNAADVMAAYRKEWV